MKEFEAKFTGYASYDEQSEVYSTLPVSARFDAQEFEAKVTDCASYDLQSEVYNACLCLISSRGINGRIPAVGEILNKYDTVGRKQGTFTISYVLYYITLSFSLPKLLTITITIVLASNPYVATFRRLADLGPLDNYRVTLNASVELEQRVYNRPTTSEVAGIWVEGNDNITAYKRSIIIYGRADKPQYIQHYWACYDPLCYPLFFPNGEA
ncbi:hypothetical protein LXL04_026082 [Taraxacum kok-saghyz]